MHGDVISIPIGMRCNVLYPRRHLSGKELNKSQLASQSDLLAACSVHLSPHRLDMSESFVCSELQCFGGHQSVLGELSRVPDQQIGICEPWRAALRNSKSEDTVVDRPRIAHIIEQSILPEPVISRLVLGWSDVAVLRVGSEHRTGSRDAGRRQVPQPPGRRAEDRVRRYGHGSGPSVLEGHAGPDRRRQEAPHRGRPAPGQLGHRESFP